MRVVDLDAALNKFPHNFVRNPRWLCHIEGCFLPRLRHSHRPLTQEGVQELQGTPYQQPYGSTSAHIGLACLLSGTICLTGNEARLAQRIRRPTPDAKRIRS